MKAVLDTNFYCLCDTANEKAVSQLEQSTQIYLPSIVYGELYYGFKNGNRFEENFRRLNYFIREFLVEIIEVDQAVAKKFGDIFTALRKKGKPIPTNDIWISACCMEVRGTLLTLDRHFLEVDQIHVEWIPAEPLPF